jgi:chromosome segregation ATPase
VKDIAILTKLADRYLEASAKKEKATEGKLKKDAEAADTKLSAVKQALDDAKTALLEVSKDTASTAAQIQAAAQTAKQREDDYKAARKLHKTQTEPYRQAVAAAKAYRGYARMFQTHIARISVALRCKQDLTCYANTLGQSVEKVAGNSAPYIKDIADWTNEEKLGLLEGEIERAMLELGKAGPKADAHTETLLDAAKSDNRLIRQSVLLALPKIAKVPCPTCIAKLDAAIQAGEGKTTLGDLNLETTMLRNYFEWAGGKTAP